MFSCNSNLTIFKIKLGSECLTSDLASISLTSDPGVGFDMRKKNHPAMLMDSTGFHGQIITSQ